MKDGFVAELKFVLVEGGHLCDVCLQFTVTVHYQLRQKSLCEEGSTVVHACACTAAYLPQNIDVNSANIIKPVKILMFAQALSAYIVGPVSTWVFL